MFHLHHYKKPIASKYVSFSTRDIIYECSCGARKVRRVRKAFGDAFPIETNSLITNKEFNAILNKTNHP